MSTVLLSYTKGATGLWLHDDEISTYDPEHDFESREDDLFTLIEYSNDENPATKIHDYHELRNFFPDNLKIEYNISCHRIRESNTEFEYTNYVFFKFESIPLPVACHKTDNTGNKAYFHILSNNSNSAGTSKIDYLRCLSLAFAGDDNTIGGSAEALLNILKSTKNAQGLVDEDELIEAINNQLIPDEPIQVRWNCKPPK